MSFLTITKDGETIELEIETESASEAAPEFIGSTERAFDGSFRGDKEEFRVWNVVAVNLFQSDFEALRAMVRNDAAVSIGGAAMGAAAPVLGIVEIGEAPYVDDNRAPDDEGFTRTVALTIREG